MDSFAIIVLLVIILSFVAVTLIMKLRYRLPWKDFFRSINDPDYNLLSIVHRRYAKVRAGKQTYERYRTEHRIQETLAVSDTWQEFSDKLAQIGISFRFRYNKDTNGIEGISYTVDHTSCSVASLNHDVSFTGKKLDKSLTLKEVCKQPGNPKTIAHESAREIYEQCKEDYQFRCTMEEFRHINEKFPDFDTLFAAQGKDAERPFPAIEGDYPYS